MNTAKLLLELSNSFGPVGYEDEVRDVIRKWIGPYVTSISTDALGNLIAFRKGNGKMKLGVFTHIDEVSLVISAIDNRGFARFETLGGIDPKVLISQKVKVICRDGKERRGVIGMLAPHLQKASTKTQVPGYDEMFIDMSMNPDFEEIGMGDLAVIDIKALEMNGKISGKALDDRACAAISILTAKNMGLYASNPDVYFVFTSREEIGAMGAQVAAQALDLDLGIAMDVTHVSKPNDVDLGKGPALTVGGPNIDKRYFKLLDDFAKSSNIQVQYEIGAGRTGTDADVVQIANQGIPTLLASLPQLFMHTPVEVVQISDVENTAKLLSGFFASLEEGETK